MSYVGGLFTQMEVLGLANALEEICLANVVRFMMSCKAISSALRAHVFVVSALMVDLDAVNTQQRPIWKNLMHFTP